MWAASEVITRETNDGLKWEDLVQAPSSKSPASRARAGFTRRGAFCKNAT